MIFKEASPVGVGARPGGHVDDTAGEPPEFGAAVVGLHPKLGHRLRAGCQHHDIAVGRILHRHAVEVRGALVCRSAADLEVSGREYVLSRQTPLAASLWNDRRSERDQIQHVAAVERQLLHGTGANQNSDRRVLGLQHRRHAGDLHCLGKTPQLEGDVDTGGGLYVDFNLIPHVALKPRQVNLEAVVARHEILEPVHAIVPGHALAALAGRAVHQGDGRAWNDLFLIIFHHRDQRPVEALGQCRDANQGQQDENKRSSSPPRMALKHGPSSHKNAALPRRWAPICREWIIDYCADCQGLRGAGHFQSLRRRRSLRSSQTKERCERRRNGEDSALAGVTARSAVE